MPGLTVSIAEPKFMDAVKKVGEWRVASAFKQSTFVYGTQGTGSKIVKGLRAWAARPRTAKPGDTSGVQQQVIARKLNLFDPGRRAESYLAGGHQMMDLYYGQEGTNLHEKRDPAIAEFVHYAMGFKGEFSMKQSGRDAYKETFKTTVEGWDSNSPSVATYGITATKEMSRIIRWGIHRFGGTLIFEGREVYYGQVFNKVGSVGDTDLEAQELFRFFSPGLSTVAFGKGKLVFYWSGRQMVPTKLHFLSNWSWAGGATHQSANKTRKTFAPDASLRDIWDNFANVPGSLVGENEEALAQIMFRA